MQRKRRNYRILLIVILFAAWVGGSAAGILSGTDGPPPAPVDAAIVLGAAVWENEPSPVLRERLHHAVWLYRQGFVKKLLLTGGRGAPGELTEAEVSRDYAVSLGVPQEDIYLEPDSAITEENLANARIIADKKGLHSFAIVSDPLHMKRAMTIARDLGMDAYPAPTTTSAYKSWRTKLPFFVRELFFYLGYQLSQPLRWIKRDFVSTVIVSLHRQ